VKTDMAMGVVLSIRDRWQADLKHFVERNGEVEMAALFQRLSERIELIKGAEKVFASEGVFALDYHLAAYGLATAILEAKGYALSANAPEGE
jgi:hypothetical protein